MLLPAYAFFPLLACVNAPVPFSFFRPQQPLPFLPVPSYFFLSRPVLSSVELPSSPRFPSFSFPLFFSFSARPAFFLLIFDSSLLPLPYFPALSVYVPVPYFF
jgi:hypothetical protein